jgi:phage baseplate assembly protein W
VGAFSFKSVGQTTQQISQQPTGSKPPVGIKTPLELGANEGIFKMHFNVADQLHDNLKNLLLTNWGDRPVHYYLGANLRKLTTEFVSQEDFDISAATNIKDAVGKWMPFIDLEGFLTEIDHTDNKNTAKVNLTVTYNIPAINVKSRKLQIILYVV